MCWAKKHGGKAEKPRERERDFIHDYDLPNKQVNISTNTASYELKAS